MNDMNLKKYKYLSRIRYITDPWDANKDLSLDIKEIYKVVSAIHYDACKKYPAFGWEAQPTSKADASPSCNLNAILRHCLQMASGCVRDHESGFLHVWHLCCRLQMYISSLYRTYASKENSRCFIKKFLISEHLLDTYNVSAKQISMITPEFVYISILAQSDTYYEVGCFIDILESYLNILGQKEDPHTNLSKLVSLARFFMVQYLDMIDTLPIENSSDPNDDLSANKKIEGQCVLLTRHLFSLFYCTKRVMIS